MVPVREARPADVPEICRVHCSEVTGWTRTLPDGSFAPARYEELSPFERWRQGGPHMDPTLLQRHLEELSRLGELALVAEDPQGHVVGEIEVFIGPEPGRGRVAYVSNLNVLRERWRQGYGRALLQETERRARQAACGAIMLRPAPDVLEFYRRTGIAEVFSRQHDLRVLLPSGPPPDRKHRLAPGPLDSFEPLAELPLVLGRFQGSYQVWKTRRLSLPGITDRAEPEEGRIPSLGAYYRLERAIFAPPGVREAYLFAWGPEGIDRRELARTLLGEARSRGFEAAWTAVEKRDVNLFEGWNTVEREQFPFLGKPLRV